MVFLFAMRGWGYGFKYRFSGCPKDFDKIKNGNSLYVHLALFLSIAQRWGVNEHGC